MIREDHIQPGEPSTHCRADRAATRTSQGSRASRPHRNWHSRGYLPHCDTPNLIQSITFRLDDALPRDAVERMDGEADSRQKRKRIEDLLAAGRGQCWLARVEIAGAVESALLHFDGKRYRLLAWCVMPNHVHALIETCEGHPLSQVVHSWKSYTAKQINSLLERDGPVWHVDYFDRYIRDDLHLAAVIRYIEDNPVAAGLVERAEQWAFSSAAQAWRTSGRQE